MMTEGRVRAIAAQVAAAIAAKIKPSVSEEQIRSDVEAVIRQMQENGELTGSDLTDEQIAAVQENAEAALSAKSAAESARDQANQSATNAANSAGTASTAAANATSAKTAAETAKGEAQTAATNAGKSATAAAGSATTASNAATAAQTAQGKAETAQAAAESAKSTASQKATEATNAAQTATSKATEASQSATAAGTAKSEAEAAAARAEEAANRLLGVAVVGVIETVNGAPAVVLTGVQEVADYTAYFKVIDEDGNETLVEIGPMVPKDETDPEPVTTSITITKDMSMVVGTGEDKEVAAFVVTPTIDVSAIPKPITINLKGACWAYANASDTGYVRFHIANKSGTKLASDYTHSSKMPTGVTMVYNEDTNYKNERNNVTVTIDSDNIGTVRFSGCYGNTAVGSGTGNAGDAEATMTYTPVS